MTNRKSDIEMPSGMKRQTVGIISFYSKVSSKIQVADPPSNWQTIIPELVF